MFEHESGTQVKWGRRIKQKRAIIHLKKRFFQEIRERSMGRRCICSSAFWGSKSGVSLF